MNTFKMFFVEEGGLRLFLTIFQHENGASCKAQSRYKASAAPDPRRGAEFAGFEWPRQGTVAMCSLFLRTASWLRNPTSSPPQLVGQAGSSLCNLEYCRPPDWLYGMFDQQCAPSEKPFIMSALCFYKNPPAVSFTREFASNLTIEVNIRTSIKDSDAPVTSSDKLLEMAASVESAIGSSSTEDGKDKKELSYQDRLYALLGIDSISPTSLLDLSTTKLTTVSQDALYLGAEVFNTVGRRQHDDGQYQDSYPLAWKAHTTWMACGETKRALECLLFCLSTLRPRAINKEIRKVAFRIESILTTEGMLNIQDRRILAWKFLSEIGMICFDYGAAIAQTIFQKAEKCRKKLTERLGATVTATHDGLNLRRMGSTQGASFHTQGVELLAKATELFSSIRSKQGIANCTFSVLALAIQHGKMDDAVALINAPKSPLSSASNWTKQGLGSLNGYLAREAGHGNDLLEASYQKFRAQKIVHSQILVGGSAADHAFFRPDVLLGYTDPRDKEHPPIPVRRNLPFSLRELEGFMKLAEA